MQPNWFVAIPCPVGPWFEEMLESQPRPNRLRTFAPGDLHITVAFLGAVEESAARAAFAMHSLWPVGAQQVTLGKVVPMGPPRRYSALSALLDEGRMGVEAGIGACCNAMRLTAGLEAEQREPLAHMTLARPMRRASAADRHAALSWSEGLLTAGQPLSLSELALFTWAERRTERLFRIVERVRL